ncbi:hypothetical protein LTR36_005239 [Oleoguttula mirabilis]|uniref:Glycoside hydrolase family 76 protein n=1 Tax=Oleoguttula mirabilis TaxID=1507867 RepID=A0AAV9JW57_9PEZI|nr:hypothetical protein LTR36_005239 [Oleoguttula mirabilis]
MLSALLYVPSPTRALPLLPRTISHASYVSNAVSAVGSLNNKWFSQSNGQWDNLWWNSANIVTTIADLAHVNTGYMETASGIFENVFFAAQASNNGSWLNDFYDDEQWWALAWIKVYDLTNNGTYLLAAQSIFEDLKGGTGATCGGQWWDKDHNATNTINNELYLAVGASLANRVRDNREYKDAATQQADWLFNTSRLMNSNNTFVDGLELSDCTPEGPVWSYNQGVVLGALVEMSRLTGDSSYLDTAATIAQGTLRHLTVSGILTETAAYPNEDSTAAQFKGVFARNLVYLQNARGNGDYVSFLQNNADSIWSNNRQSDGQVGADWQGPVVSTGAAAQSSALDCLVAAAAVSSQSHEVGVGCGATKVDVL